MELAVETVPTPGSTLRDFQCKGFPPRTFAVGYFVKIENRFFKSFSVCYVTVSQPTTARQLCFVQLNQNLKYR